LALKLLATFLFVDEILKNRDDVAVAEFYMLWSIMSLLEKVLKCQLKFTWGPSWCDKRARSDVGASAFRSQFAPASSARGSKVITGANQAIKRRAGIVKYKK
jgi:hypothetical protein